MPGFGFGCCCGGNSIITSLGCNSVALPGVGVVVKIGSTVYYSGTSDGLGQVSCVLPTAGIAYTVVLTAPSGAGFTTTTTTFTPPSFPAVFSAALTVDSAYVCCSVSVYPIPRTIYVTIPDGTYTLSRGASFWIYNGTNNTAVYPTQHDGPPITCGNTDVIGILIQMGCTSSGFGMSLTWGSVILGTCAGNYTIPYGNNQGYSQASAVVPSSYLPFTASGTMTRNAGSTANPCGGGAWTATA